jgi:hypothetical protein
LCENSNSFLTLIVTCCVIFRDEITALVDDIVINTKKLIKATSREIDKWRR